MNIQLPQAIDFAWAWCSGKNNRHVQAIPVIDSAGDPVLHEHKGKMRAVTAGNFIATLRDKKLIVEYLPSREDGQQCLCYRTCSCEYCIHIFSVTTSVDAMMGVFNWSTYIQSGYWSSLKRIDNFMNTLQELIDEVQEKVNEV